MRDAREMMCERDVRERDMCERYARDIMCERDATERDVRARARDKYN